MAQQDEDDSDDRPKQVHQQVGQKEDEVYEARVDNAVKGVERND